MPLSSQTLSVCLLYCCTVPQRAAPSTHSHGYPSFILLLFPRYYQIYCSLPFLPCLPYPCQPAWSPLPPILPPDSRHSRVQSPESRVQRERKRKRALHPESPAQPPLQSLHPGPGAVPQRPVLCLLCCAVPVACASPRAQALEVFLPSPAQVRLVHAYSAVAQEQPEGWTSALHGLGTSVGSSLNLVLFADLSAGAGVR